MCDSIVMCKHLGKAEICDLGNAFAEKNVVCFEVAMDHIFLVQTLETVDNLFEDMRRSFLGETA